MKLKNIYVVDVFMPTEICCSAMIGISDLKIYKSRNWYIYRSWYKKIYGSSSNGYEKILHVIPLSEYFYKIGLKKSNDCENKEQVYKLVKRYKINKLL